MPKRRESVLRRRSGPTRDAQPQHRPRLLARRQIRDPAPTVLVRALARPLHRRKPDKRAARPRRCHAEQQHGTQPKPHAMRYGGITTRLSAALRLHLEVGKKRGQRQAGGLYTERLPLLSLRAETTVAMVGTRRKKSRQFVWLSSSPPISVFPRSSRKGKERRVSASSQPQRVRP